MTTVLPDTTLARVSQFVATRMGLQFPRERWPDLERGLHAVAHESGFATLEPCVEWLMSSSSGRRQVEALAGHLTVGETYFFREPRTFEALERHVLPERVQAHDDGQRQLRLWSAACATGEEPYSLAITVQRVIPGLVGWQVALLATDVNPRRLRQAATGAYGPWSFRDAPGWLKPQYFTPAAQGRFQVAPAIRSMVNFAYLNLAEDSYPSLLNGTNAMDVILCRNILMYFSPDKAARVLENLSHCLCPGGWLIVGPSEAPHLATPGLVPVNFPGATLYQKAEHGLPSRPKPPFSSEAEAGTSPEAAPEASIEFKPEPPWQRPLWSSAPEPILSDQVVPEPAPALAVPPAEAQFAAALRLHEGGAYDESAAALEGLLRDHPAFLPAMLLLAQTLANQGRLAGALEWCDRTLAVDKLNCHAHYLRAGILQEQGALDAVGTALQRVLYLDPDFVLAHVALGNLALRLGRSEAAGRHFRNALRLLANHAPGEVLAEAEGVTAGRLAEIIAATRELEPVP